MKDLKYFIQITETIGINDGPSYYAFYRRKIQTLKDEGYTIRRAWLNWLLFVTDHHYVDSADATILALQHPEIRLFKND